MAIFLDGQEFQDGVHYEINNNQNIPVALKKEFNDLMEINANSKSGDFKSRFNAVDTAPRMAPEASTELADALKRSQGVLPTVGDAPISDGGVFSPGVPFFNKLAEAWGKPHEPIPEGKTLFETPSGIKITEGDINRSIEVGLGVSGGGMTVKGKPSMEFNPLYLRELDGVAASKEFHKIYNEKGSAEAINFAHKYEENATYNNFVKYEEHVNEISNHPTSKAFGNTSPYDQVPYGWSPNEWKQLTPEAKAQITDKPMSLDLNNPTDKVILDIQKALYGVKSERVNIPIKEGPTLEARDFGSWKYSTDGSGKHVWESPGGQQVVKYPDGTAKPFDVYPNDGKTSYKSMNEAEAFEYMHSVAKMSGAEFFEKEGFKVDLSKLNLKQYKDFLKLDNRYNNGEISLYDYKKELKEYQEFTMNKGKTPGLSEEEKIDKKFDSYIEMFMSPKEVQKLSPKEAFKRGVVEAHAALLDTFQNLKSKFKNKVAEGKPEDVPQVEGRGDYTEPAYRGVRIYEGKELNPVYDFPKGSGELYSTASPMLADMYSSYKNSHPGRYTIPKEGTFDEGAQVLPLLINTKEYHYFDAKGARWQEANPKAIREARDQGKKGVVVDNVWDEPNSTHNLGPKKIYITFPKGASTVKSRFAERFDPSSPNIMHAIPVIGVGGAAGYISMEQANEN